MLDLFASASGVVLVVQAAFRPEPLDVLAAVALVLLTLGLIASLLWRTAGEGWRRRRREREAARSLNADLDALLADVRRALIQPDVLNLDTAEAAVPTGAGAAGRLLAERLPAENAPVERSVDRYREQLPRRAAVLDLLVELRRAEAAFYTAARRLDRRVIEVISEHNVRLHIDPLADPLERSYFLGCALGMPELKLDHQTGLSSDGVEAVRARAKAIAADPEVAVLVQPYLEARANLAAAAEGLWESGGSGRRRQGDWGS